VYTIYTRPSPPVIPRIEWLDIPDYYGLREHDFDSLQYFLDQYEGYIEKVDRILSSYEHFYSEAETSESP
jgi:hypothetical protein